MKVNIKNLKDATFCSIFFTNMFLEQVLEVKSIKMVKLVIVAIVTAAILDFQPI